MICRPELYGCVPVTHEHMGGAIHSQFPLWELAILLVLILGIPLMGAK